MRRSRCPDCGLRGVKRGRHERDHSAAVLHGLYTDDNHVLCSGSTTHTLRRRPRSIYLSGLPRTRLGAATARAVRAHSAVACVGVARIGAACVGAAPRRAPAARRPRRSDARADSKAPRHHRQRDDDRRPPRRRRRRPAHLSLARHRRPRARCSRSPAARAARTPCPPTATTRSASSAPTNCSRPTNTTAPSSSGAPKSTSASPRRRKNPSQKWGHDRVLYDAVLAVRRERPQVIVSTFVGGITDGHGQHQVSGEIAQEVFKAAADPNVFPEQLKPRRRPRPSALAAARRLLHDRPSRPSPRKACSTTPPANGRLQNSTTTSPASGSPRRSFDRCNLPVGTLDLDSGPQLRADCARRLGRTEVAERRRQPIPQRPRHCQLSPLGRCAAAAPQASDKTPR